MSSEDTNPDQFPACTQYPDSPNPCAGTTNDGYLTPVSSNNKVGYLPLLSEQPAEDGHLSHALDRNEISEWENIDNNSISNQVDSDSLTNPSTLCENTNILWTSPNYTPQNSSYDSEWDEAHLFNNSVQDSPRHRQCCSSSDLILSRLLNTDSISQSPNPCNAQTNQYASIPERTCENCRKMSETSHSKKYNKLRYMVLLSLTINIALLIVFILIYIKGSNQHDNDPTFEIDKLLSDVQQSSVCLKCEYFMIRKRKTLHGVSYVKTSLRDYGILCCYSRASSIKKLLKIILLQKLKANMDKTKLTEKLKDSHTPTAAIVAHVHLQFPHNGGGKKEDIANFGRTRKFTLSKGVILQNNTYLEITESGFYCIYLFLNLRLSYTDNSGKVKQNIEIYLKKKMTPISHRNETLQSTIIQILPVGHGTVIYQNESIFTFAYLERGNLIFSTISDSGVMYGFDECNFMGMFRVV